MSALAPQTDRGNQDHQAQLDCQQSIVLGRDQPQSLPQACPWRNHRHALIAAGKPPPQNSSRPPQPPPISQQSEGRQRHHQRPRLPAAQRHHRQRNKNQNSRRPRRSRKKPASGRRFPSLLRAQIPRKDDRPHHQRQSQGFRVAGKQTKLAGQRTPAAACGVFPPPTIRLPPSAAAQKKKNAAGGDQQRRSHRWHHPTQSPIAAGYRG